MDNIIWMACKKVVILNTVLYFLNLCSPSDPLGLTKVYFLSEGLLFSKSIYVTVNETYSLILDAHAPLEDKNMVDKFIGIGSESIKCKSYQDVDLLYMKHNAISGMPTKIKITIYDKDNKKFVVNREFDSACMYSHGFENYSSQRELAKFYLSRGRYDVSVYNVLAIPEISGIDTRVYLRVGDEPF